MIREALRSLRHWVSEKFIENPQTVRTEVEDFLRRVKKDLKKKKFVGRYAPIGSLPGSYVPLPEEDDRWIDVDGASQVRLSEIMEYHARHYRWNPLNDEGCIYIPLRGEALERFWKSRRQDEAIEFYKEAMLKKRRDNTDVLDQFEMSDD